jgi:hypothetical protein
LGTPRKPKAVAKKRSPKPKPRAAKKSPPAKPAKKKTAAKARAEARSHRIAESVVKGESVTKIAHDEKISRSWASTQANSPAVQQIIASLVNTSHERIHKMFLRSLDVIEGAFKAMSIAQFQGTPVVMGPDHYARLAAAKRFVEFAMAGRAVPKDADSGEKAVTLDDIKRIMQQKESVQ